MKDIIIFIFFLPFLLLGLAITVTIAWFMLHVLIGVGSLAIGGLAIMLVMGAILDE